MYLSEKPRPIDFYKDSSSTIELIPPPTNHDPPRHLIGDINNTNSSSGGSEDPNGCSKGTITKKRAETWVTEETKTLINLRRQVDNLFNTSKSNKHLWEGISNKMREKGFDRSPTMCTDKWRNLLKEYKKIKQQQLTNSSNCDNNSCGKVLYYKELEELLRDRSRGGGGCGGSSGGGGNSTVKLLDSFIQFSDKGIEDASITFGPVEAGGRSAINLETHLDHDGDPLPIAVVDAVAANEVPPWNWRETPGNGEGQSSYEGRVISVKWGEYTRRIGIDGTSAAIKDAIKSAFRLRTKRAFWLEDEDQVIRSLDRDMPLGNYTLHLDEGITIKVCIYDDANRIMVRNEEKTLYTEEDFCDFLTRRGLAGLRELNGYRSIDTLDDLRSGGVYEGVRSG